jgi:protein-disulfide isomerase
MEEKTEKQKDYLLPFSILIAAILIAGALIYSAGAKNTKTENQKEEAPKAAELSKPQIDDDVVLGDPNAAVTIFIFGDYQCSFCGKFFKETEPLIRKNYVETGKVKVVSKDLAFLGPESTAAAEAAQCAKDQGKYWQYYDALYNEEIKDGQTNNGNLNRDLFKKIALNLKMNADEFLSCFDSKKYENEVRKDIEEAKNVMERISTPTIFINGKMIQGAYPYDVFSQAIDEALTKE